MTPTPTLSGDHPDSGDPRRPVRQSRPRGEARRRQILDTASRLFAANGFNNVGLAELATAVGITQAGLLHHFDSKGALLLEVLKKRESRNVEERDEHEANGLAPMEAYVETLRSNQLHPELVQLFVVLAAESTALGHPAHDWFVERNTDVFRGLSQRVRATFDEERFPPGVTVEMVTRWLLGLAHGLAAMWVFDPSAFDRAEYVARFLGLLDPYLKNRPSNLEDTPA